jgi:hypothetical protein
MHYQEKLDAIFGKGDLWKHRTLRTVFDPYSSEYDKTTIEQKLDILKTIKSNKIDLKELVEDYSDFYLEENKRHVVNAVAEGLVILLSNLLNEK